jgi:hypothetical protein
MDRRTLVGAVAEPSSGDIPRGGTPEVGEGVAAKEADHPAAASSVRDRAAVRSGYVRTQHRANVPGLDLGTFSRRLAVVGGWSSPNLT